MNIQVQLIPTNDNGVETIGKLYVTGDIHFACDTLERTYDNNKRGISSIPSGRYLCVKAVASEAIPYQHISITNVPNRSGVCMHKGNLYTHSKGCIIVGKGFGDINKDGQLDILNSKITFDSLMATLPEEFSLTISERPTPTKPQLT